MAIDRRALGRGMAAEALWRRLALRAVTPQTGSIHQRERVSIRSDSVGRLLDLLRASASADEWLVLSTCGRTEVYAVTGETASALDDAIATSFGTLGAAEMSSWL